MGLGGILTAMVTPFEANGDLAEDSAVRLMRHLLANGSDGLVLAGTTGEASTLDDEEKCRLWELAVAECSDSVLIAGTGSNDTRHSAALTERATGIGVDAVLVVSPYYNRPNRRGVIEHYRAVASSTDKPVVVYNIPQRSAIDMPNDLLRELAEIENIVAVKQARYENLEAIDGLDLLAGNDDMLADVLDIGGTGGILVASHLVGAEMGRMLGDAERRHEIQDSLRPLYGALGVAPAAVSVKAALNMLGLDVGGLRLPYVEASEDEQAQIRTALERHGLLTAV